MSLEPRLVFLNSPSLGQPGSLEATLAIIQSKGYEIVDLRVGSQKAPVVGWDKYDLNTQHDLGIVYEKRQLSFRAQNAAERFELSLWIRWDQSAEGEVHMAYVSAVCFQTALFNRSEYNPEHSSRLFVEFGKSLYKVIVPDFGWIDICEPAGCTWYDDVSRLAVPHVYWANFFGRSYVAKFGRERMLRAPVWSIEELNDGGLLYILSPSLTSASPDRDSNEVVKGYLESIAT